MSSFDPVDQEHINGVKREDLNEFAVFLNNFLFLVGILNLRIDFGDKIEKL